MAYQHHLNKNSRRITLHEISCRQWKKHHGTAFHKHGEKNSFYLDNENLHIEDYGTARDFGKKIAKMNRFTFHECSFCCGKKF